MPADFVSALVLFEGKGGIGVEDSKTGENCKQIRQRFVVRIICGNSPAAKQNCMRNLMCQSGYQVHRLLQLARFHSDKMKPSWRIRCLILPRRTAFLHLPVSQVLPEVI